MQLSTFKIENWRTDFGILDTIMYLYGCSPDICRALNEKELRAITSPEASFDRSRPTGVLIARKKQVRVIEIIFFSIFTSNLKSSEALWTLKCQMSWVLILIQFDFDVISYNHWYHFWKNVPEKITLVELAWTFYMFFKVASNFFNDFLNLLRKLQCVIISLLSSTFIKLLQRIIKVLAAISSREVLQVSICISSNFKCSWDLNNFAAILMQVNFIHNVNSKLASSSASYLRSGG